MKWNKHTGPSGRRNASMGVCLLVVAALSMQAFAALCACGSHCGHRPGLAVAAKTTAPVRSCCEAAKPAEQAPVDPAAPSISRECACAHLAKEVVTGVQASPAPEYHSVHLPAIVPVLLSASNELGQAPAIRAAESPPPRCGLALLNHALLC